MYKSGLHKIFIAMLFVVCVANAANFGSTVKSNPITIKENQSSEFSLLFWTMDNEIQKVKLTLLSAPEKFSVNFQKEIEISKTKGNEMVYAQGYIAATSVKIFFDQNAVPERYNIIISAIKIPASGEVLFAQERVFNLTVIVEGRSNVINIDIPTVPTRGAKPQANYTFPFAILVIIFISFLIYRYS